MAKKITGIYILGTGRSGTTMMNKLVSSHPDIAGVMQSEILKHFTYKIENIKDLVVKVSEGKKESDMVNAYFKKNFPTKKTKDTNPYEFMYHFCCAHANYHKKSFYTEKSPIHTLFAEQIVDRIPNSKVLIVLRDPRSTLFSKNNARTANRGKIYNFPKVLRHYLNLSEILFTYNYFSKLYEKHKDSPNYLFIKYEDLINKPKEEFDRIFSFIGVKSSKVDENFSPNDLRLEIRKRSNVKINSSFKEEKTKSKSVLSNNSLDRWKVGLTKKEILEAEKAFYNSSSLLSNNFYPDIKKSKNSPKSLFLINLSKLDKFVFLRKNISQLNKVK